MVCFPFPPMSPISAAAIALSAASGAAFNLERNPAVARQLAQEKKYPLWKYVRRQQGPEAKLAGGGNVPWTFDI